MAGTTGKTSPDLKNLLELLKERPYEFGFFHLMRLLDCLNRQGARLGESKKPADDPVRLAQEPEMSFAPATITQYEESEKKQIPRLLVRFLGLLGPNGPLPLHLTEYARSRLRPPNHDRTFAWFLDVFHHRMLSLFYRAWAINEPTVSYDRPESDRFSLYIGSLAGRGLPAMLNQDAMPDLSKRYYCGLLANQARNAAGLEAMVRDFFGIPARVEEFIGEWLPIPPQHLGRLGKERATGTLGHSAFLGVQVWSCQHKFRLVLGPLDYEDYYSFLPPGHRLQRLKDLVRNYVGDELAWEVNLILNREDTPTTRLNGHFHLGWTTWLGRGQSTDDADDLILEGGRPATPNPGGRL
ncbi:MAG: type VI secretion system baseplate subunit TssG [Syntrophobacterales bacterium]|nr:MAG: type VI secretion system baseplate subunit TssG [Syntrophobacterales bacterium]